MALLPTSFFSDFDSLMERMLPGRFDQNTDLASTQPAVDIKEKDNAIELRADSTS